MPGNFQGRRGGYKKNPKLSGRGVLEKVETDGPHTEWVGMPPYYIHMITVDGEEYSYLSPDKDIEIELGKKVTFRYKETSKGKFIDKRSLGVVIDPSELGY
ncbi:hypothetical protein [Neptuniibacter sp.]|uniref:hypothetical protein n=1 Tax=Neptuniibacter sp. TaxID=1962643 RepID=UPI00260DE9D8|nr:hypothetical protein [Neptuniibacter sp.]MCP4596736.1 hypothetical protein [Neptuniibacter sp.]